MERNFLCEVALECVARFWFQPRSDLMFVTRRYLSVTRSHMAHSCCGPTNAHTACIIISTLYICDRLRYQVVTVPVRYAEGSSSDRHFRWFHLTRHRHTRKCRHFAAKRAPCARSPINVRMTKRVDDEVKTKLNPRFTFGHDSMHAHTLRGITIQHSTHLQ